MENQALYVAGVFIDKLFSQRIFVILYALYSVKAD